MKKGGLAAYDPSKGLKWRFELPDSVEANASPAIDASENIYFAASFGERLYSINKDGQINWVFDIAPGVEPTHGHRWCWGDEVCPDQFTYGVAPVIGLGGSIYVMGAKNLYAIEGVSFETVAATIQGLISDGALTTGAGTALINKLKEASVAPTPQAKEHVLNALINQINALEKSGKIDSSTAAELRGAINQL